MGSKGRHDLQLDTRHGSRLSGRFARRGDVLGAGGGNPTTCQRKNRERCVPER